MNPSVHGHDFFGRPVPVRESAVSSRAHNAPFGNRRVVENESLAPSQHPTKRVLIIVNISVRHGIGAQPSIPFQGKRLMLKNEN